MSTGIPADTVPERHYSSKTIGRYATATARVLMGLLFCLTGLNGFLRFLPEPDPSTIPANAGTFMGGLMATGYMFPMIAGTQLLVGILLVTNLFVPLALVLIAPIVVNIIAFHLFLAPSGTGIALIVLALEIFLIYSYRHAYRPLFTPHVRPTGS